MALEEKVDQLAATVQSLAAAVAKHEERFDRIDKSIERFSNLFLDFRRAVAERFQVLENRLEITSLTLSSIETRFASLTKAILDFGGTASHLIREQASKPAA